jgi:hypothetical protein
MQISFDMLPLWSRRIFCETNAEADQSGRPGRIGDSGGVAVSKKILCVRNWLSRREIGGGSLEKLPVVRGTSWRREFVTASAKSIGGAVTRLNALIPSILPSPVIYPAG